MSCDCGNCYFCADGNETSYQFNKVMNISVYNRIKFGCNCYMCNDPRSASCIEISLLNEDMDFDIVNEKIRKIKLQIKTDNKKIIRKYILCLVKFNSLYNDTIEKRYSPPFGNGYIEAKKNFEKNIYMNDNEYIDSENMCAEYYQYKYI